MQELKDRNDLVDHLIKLIESDDEQYSFEWSCGNAMEIFDKEKKVGYILHIDKIDVNEDQIHAASDQTIAAVLKFEKEHQLSEEAKNMYHGNY